MYYTENISLKCQKLRSKISERLRMRYTVCILSGTATHIPNTKIVSYAGYCHPLVFLNILRALSFELFQKYSKSHTHYKKYKCLKNSTKFKILFLSKI